MTRYKIAKDLNHALVTDPDGDWVRYVQALKIEEENIVLRKQLEYYKNQSHYHIQDECELEAALEKCGVVFYDDYGHVGILEATVEFIEHLKKERGHDEDAIAEG